MTRREGPAWRSRREQDARRFGVPPACNSRD